MYASYPISGCSPKIKLHPINHNYLHKFSHRYNPSNQQFFAGHSVHSALKFPSKKSVNAHCNDSRTFT